MSDRFKWLVTAWGLILLVPGVLAILVPCPASILFISTMLAVQREGLPMAISLVVMLAVALGGGGLTFYQGSRSLRNKPSRLIRLPPLWAVGGGFILVLAVGLGLQQLPLVPVLSALPLMAAALAPPVAAVVWMLEGQPGALTWRRAGVAFVAGATVSVIVVSLLQLLFPGILLLLVLGLAEPVVQAVEDLFQALAGREVAGVLTSPGFLVALVEFAVVAPLVEEAVKPLVTLPLVRQFERRRDALLLGAVAGAGFAALENTLYATAGLPIWAGILAIRALGGAVHPLGTGLVTLGWHGLLRRQPGAGLGWLSRYGLAVGIHALWNGALVLLLALLGAQFFGEAPPEVDVLGMTVAGSLLALLALVGAAAFVGARALARRLAVPEEGEVEEAPLLGGLAPDQVMAIWALVCLLALLPVALALLQAMW
jgi:RsiW-degrading membrane proteinase PrsW (M82 family)